MALTEQTVFDAADQIRESGRVPSAITIREITQTGSLGTIQKFLRKWRHRETVSSASINPPPEQVLTSIRQFGEQLWQLALQQAEKSASIKVRQAREEQDDAQRDTDEAMSQLEAHQDRLQQQEEQLQQQQEELSTFRQQRDAWQNLEQELVASKQQLENQLLRVGDQLSLAEKQLSEYKTNLEAERQKVASLDQKLNLKNSEYSDLQRDNSVLKNQAQSQIDLNNHLEIQNKGLALEKEEIQQKLQKIEYKLEKAEEQLQSFEKQGQQHQMEKDEARRLSMELESEKQINRRLEDLLSRLQPVKST